MTRVLITGTAGAVGSTLLSELDGPGFDIIATDLHSPGDLPDTARFVALDVRGAERPDVVIHFASIVTLVERNFAFTVDVQGTRNILDACLEYGVRRLVVTSSGAAYGDHAGNPQPLKETEALRGNPEFA